MVTIDVTRDLIADAHALRAERDRQFHNRDRYARTGVEERWTGDLGELTACLWFGREGVPARWYKRQPAGTCDFRVRRADVEIKTRCGATRPHPHYGVGMSVDHAHRIACDFYLFMCFEEHAARMWIPGALARNRFLYYAELLPKGSRPYGWNHELTEDRLEVPIARLTEAPEWLRQLEQDWSVRNDHSTQIFL